MSTVTIAVIDDEPHIISALRRLFRKKGWRILTFDKPQEALDSLGDEHVDLIISDYRMPEMNGVELLNRLKEKAPDALRIILSGQADLEGVIKAVNQSEVYRFILKPWSDEDLLITLENALKYKHLLAENQRLADTVRKQQRRIERQQAALQRLEQESPGITDIKWTEDGMIDLSDEEWGG